MLNVGSIIRQWFNNLFVSVIIFAASILSTVATPLAQTSEQKFSQYGKFFYFFEIPNTLFLNGAIKANDSFDFRKAIRFHDIDTLVLSSPGGSVWDALSIAGIVFDRQINTVLPENSLCASACSYIFFAGKKRFAQGPLGVHQFASVDPNAQEKIGDAQYQTQFTVSEIIGFLNQFGTPPFVLERMFQQSEMYWFNDEEIIKLTSPDFSIDQKKTELIETAVEHLINLGSSPVAPQLVEKKPIINEKEIYMLVQKKLNEVGCDAGKVDGTLGPKTVRAIKVFTKTAGVDYYDGIIFDADFIEKLSAAGEKFCPPLPPATVRVTQNPVSIPKHWKLVCNGSSNAKNLISYARTISYDYYTGEVMWVLRDLNGKEGSMAAKINGDKIKLYGEIGSFNKNFTTISFKDPSCPKGLVWESMTD